MRRFLFVIIAIVLGIVVFAVGMMLASQTPTQTLTPINLPTQTPDSTNPTTETETPAPTEILASTSTEEACTVLDMEAAPDLRLALAVDAMYEEMPLFKTPVAVVAIEEKPFSVGCIEAGD